MRKILQKREEGQAILEFLLTLIILIMLLYVPIELIRFINLRTLLCSVATESITQVRYSSVEHDTLTRDIDTIIRQTYGDRIDVNTISIHAKAGEKGKKNYTYYVYSSELAQEDPDKFWDQFEKRPANYEYAEIELQLTSEYRPVTILGSLFVGDSVTVKTPTYDMAVYAGGYVPDTETEG